MKRKLGVGICGLGFMGRTYLAHLHDHPLARVVAVADRDPARIIHSGPHGGNLNAGAAVAFDVSRVHVYDDAHALLLDPAVDVVAVTLPTPLHALVTITALEAGKHVLCEKPMALTLEECDAMLRARADAQRTLMIAQCIRFWPQYELLAEYAHASQLGALRCLNLRRLASAPTYSSRNWLMEGAQSGGALLDLHVHDVDFVHALWGLPRRIVAAGRHGPSGRIDHLVATWWYDDGRYAVLEGGWLMSSGWPFEMGFVAQGDAGTLEWSLQRGPSLQLYQPNHEPQTLAVDPANGWTRELDYFLDCVKTQRPVSRCSPESTRQSLALALREEESIRTRMPVLV